MMGSRNAGGPAAAGGMNFQAAVTSFTLVKMLCGSPVHWLSGLTADVPVSVRSETGGAGDDIYLELANNMRVEVQAKKGMRAGKDLQKALLDLARGIHEGAIDYGVLAISSTSSGTIKDKLANNIVRRGENRTDNHCKNANLFFNNLENNGYEVQQVCSKIRVVTLSFGTGDQASLDNSILHLRSILADDQEPTRVWNALYKSASDMIEHRGGKNLRALVDLFRSQGILLKREHSNEPAVVLSAFCQWVEKANSTIPMFGMNSRAEIDDCWIDLELLVQEPDHYGSSDLPEALEQYHSWGEKSKKGSDKTSDARWLGRFFRNSVVVAGPGMGKSCLMTLLAKLYSEDSFLVIKVKLKQVVQKTLQGSTFEDAMFAIGSDGSGIEVKKLREARFKEMVFLCDGLDECGKDRTQIAQKVREFAAGHQSSRVLVTTRSVGYDASVLAGWRHYDIMPPDSSSVVQNVTQILSSLGSVQAKETDWMALVESELASDHAKKIAGHSPLMTNISAVLLYHQQKLGGNKAETYQKIFKLIDSIPSGRNEKTAASKTTLSYVLDCLAWDIIKNPICETEDRQSRISMFISEALNCTPLKASEIFEDCFNYWQAKGLVETVSAGMSESVTFVHKTFCEYAAARYLAGLSEPTQSQTISEILLDSEFREVVAFAMALGCASNILQSYEQANAERTRKQKMLAFLLGAIADGAVSIDKASIDYLVMRSVEVVRSDRADLGFRVGLPLSRLAQRFPVQIGTQCPDLCNSSQIWTCLTGWTAAINSGVDHYHLDDLRSVFMRLPSDPALPDMFSPFGGIQLYDDGQRELLGDFVLSGMEQLLSRLPAEEVDSFLPNVLAKERLGSVGFVGRAQAILKKHGRSYDIKNWRMDSESLKSFARSFDPEQYHKQQKMAFDGMFSSFPLVEVNALPSEQPSNLLNLSALIEITGLWGETPREFHAWNQQHPPEPISEIWRLLLDITEIDTEILMQEVEFFKKRVDLPFDQTVLGPFHLLHHVDVPEPDFNQVNRLCPNTVLLEQAVHHPVKWVKMIAVQVLNEVLDEDQKESCIIRLFSEGERETIWMGAWLADQIDATRAFALVVERLKQPLSHGCEYLYYLLRELKFESEEEAHEALKVGLMSTRVQMAMEAAKYAVYLADKMSIDIATILFEAFDHWKINEEPYPKNGGTVPPSPRDDLLKALDITKQIDGDFLFDLFSDPRSDVRSLAEKIALGRLKQGSGEKLVDEVIKAGGHFGFLKQLIRSCSPLSDLQVSKIAELAEASEPNARLCSLMLVEEGFCSENHSTEILEHLQLDELQQIRDRARECSEKRARSE